MSRILDENPILEEVVWQSLSEELQDRGAKGLTAEQIIRLTLLKHHGQLTCDDLSYHLNETPLFQSFCRIGIGGRIPSRSTVTSALKTVDWEMIERQKKIYGRVPLKAAFDDGFASMENL